MAHKLISSQKKTIIDNRLAHTKGDKLYMDMKTHNLIKNQLTEELALARIAKSEQGIKDCEKALQTLSDIRKTIEKGDKSIEHS